MIILDYYFSKRSTQNLKTCPNMRKRREKNEAKVTKATKDFGDKKKNKLRMNFLYLLIYFIIIF